MRLLAPLALAVASTCTPGPAPSPVPTTTTTAIGTVPTSQPDAGTGDCPAARQHMVELSCQPDEDAFGGWVIECNSWPNHAVITSCIQKQKTCLGTRQCLGS